MATDPLALEAEVKALRARTAAAVSERPLETAEPIGLVNSLIKEFGLGGDPRLRRVLYDRLARLERLHGQKVETSDRRSTFYGSGSFRKAAGQLLCSSGHLPEAEGSRPRMTGLIIQLRSKPQTGCGTL